MIEINHNCPTCGTPCVVSGLPDFPGDRYPTTCYYKPVRQDRERLLRDALRSIAEAKRLKTAVEIATSALIATAPLEGIE